MANNALQMLLFEARGSTRARSDEDRRFPFDPRLREPAGAADQRRKPGPSGRVPLFRFRAPVECSQVFLRLPDHPLMLVAERTGDVRVS